MSMNIQKRMNGASEPVRCSSCFSELREERVAARCSDGKIRFFCKAEPGTKPEDTCRLQWQLSHH